MLTHGKPSPKILIRSPNWVGDAVMATPVPRALKRTLPGCRIHVLAKPWVAPVWERHPDLEQIKVLPAKKRSALLRELRREHYDLALVLPNSFSSACLAWRSGARERVGYSAQHRGIFLSARVPWLGDEHRLPRPQTYLNLARAAGADVDLAKEWVFTLRVSQEESKHAEQLLGEPRSSGLRVGLAPGSVALSRRWPVQRYAQLADLLAAAGHQVIVTGSGADAEIAQAVAQAARTKPLVLAGRTNLREAIAVTGHLDLLVSNDSGAMHLAYAQGVPALVLQGAADPQVTGPFGLLSRVLRGQGIACAPCVRNRCRLPELSCMLAISVEDAWKQVQTMLAETNGKRKADHAG